MMFYERRKTNPLSLRMVGKSINLNEIHTVNTFSWICVTFFISFALNVYKFFCLVINCYHHWVLWYITKDSSIISTCYHHTFKCLFTYVSKTENTKTKRIVFSHVVLNIFFRWKISQSVRRKIKNYMFIR